jgi:glucose/arabinose dehydrogenase
VGRGDLALRGTVTLAKDRRHRSRERGISSIVRDPRNETRAGSLALAAAALVVACGGDSRIGPSSTNGSTFTDGSIADATQEAGAGSDASQSDSASPADGDSDAGNLDSSGWVDGSSDATVDAMSDDSSGSTDGSSDESRSDATAADGPAGDGGDDAGGGPGAACSGALHSTNATLPSLFATPALTVSSGFTIQAIAYVLYARQLAALPNGDLLVGTLSSDVYLVPNAEASGAAGAAVKFATMAESPAQGIAFERSSCTIYVGTGTGIYAIPYADAQQSATPGQAIARVRPGGVSGHITTSVAFAGGMLYASVGSSCNVCTETDPTRATVQVMAADGSNMSTRASRIRNAIALATNPATGTLWAGVAGQDALPIAHPYELFDGVTLHPGIADYGWPDCEENNHAYQPGANCASTVAPLIELPAYSTLIGAAFYPLSPSGPHAFSTAFWGGVFVAAHGSWHKDAAGRYIAPPRVVFVPMNGDAPKTAVDWSDPTRQWVDFVTGFQGTDGVTRVGRPTGVAVGSAGSLFVADDGTGYIYRIRPM